LRTIISTRLAKVNTSLRDAQLRAGAVFPAAADEAGPPLHFGSPQGEYEAATTGAALFDFSDRNQIEISGSDRVKFLHNFCTNDIKQLAVGQGCEAFITNVKGRVLGHVWVSVGPSALSLDADAGSAERLIPHLERYVINEDVTIADRTQELGPLFVTGPESNGRLTRLRIEAGALANLEHTELDIAGLRVCVRRFDIGAGPGFVLVAPRNAVANLWDRLLTAECRPAGSEVWNALRIEAGLPVYGIDISDENLVQEVRRTKTAVSFTKGCYLGQEPVARIDAMGHVNRQLCALRLADGPVPPRGDRVLAKPTGGEPAGSVSSSAFSFGSGSPVAMALLRSTISAPGTEVYVQSGSEQAGTATTRATVFWAPGD
jgi:tRNA-modifying protein YgfZ